MTSSGIKTEYVEYMDGDATLEGFVAYPPGSSQCAAVLIVHAFAGREQFYDDRAVELAKLGYVGFALDVYGKGIRGSSFEENYKLMQPFQNDRKFLLKRLKAGLEALKNLPRIDKNRIAGIGYCFGGLAVLDMARGNTPIRGVVSFHGNLRPIPDDQVSYRGNIRAKVLVCHGYDDPVVKPDTIVPFCEEMKARDADYYFVAYGATGHSFTVPEASKHGVPGIAYNRNADVRSWREMKAFLQEILQDQGI